MAVGVAVIAPLAPHLPPWQTFAAAAALLWGGRRTWCRRPALPRWLPPLLVAAGSLAVFAQYRTLFGQHPGVALLVLLFGFKVLEARSIRDGWVVVFLSWFLVLAQFLYAQHIPAALAATLATLVLTAAMIALVDPGPRPFVLLRRAGTMLLQAVPCMLVLFVFFPRVQGPLWGLPRDANSSLTGLSDTMEPGSISHLSQSDAIAFRVRFSSPVPPQSLLYWRGPVLSEFDGRVWRMGRSPGRPGLPYQEPAAGAIAQEITLEAHGKPWLFAMELPGHVPDEVLATSDFQLLAKQAVVSRTRYSLRSYPQLRAGQEESPRLLQRLRHLPENSNPRIHALAELWRKQSQSDAELLRLAQTFFLGQQLRYTLEPPALGQHAADEFLFDSRQGFCEHFAGAFAVALRAAGLPARVVTGYQGGELNPIDDYLAVRQFEAHAWTEVWLDGSGWQRVDPTAITVPARIESSLASAIPADESLPLLARGDLGWLRELRLRRDALDNAWNQWVLGYTVTRQRQMLHSLGLATPDRQSLIAALAMLAALALPGLIAWLLRRHRRRDPVQHLWGMLSRRLARRGLARQAAEGPADYAARVAAALPEAAGEMRILAGVYIRLRYGGGEINRPALLAELRRRVSALRA